MRDAAIELDRAGVRPAVLAALAESGVLALPVGLLVRELLGTTAGPLATYPLFVAAFSVGVGLATAFRGWRGLTAATAAVGAGLGLVQASLAEEAGFADSTAAVALGALIGLRVLMLASRDWRDPVQGAFGIGAVALLLETILATTVDPGWEPLLPLVAVQFFVGSLASRAASVRLSGRLHGVPDERGGWVRAVAASVAGLVGAMGLLAAVGREGGPLEGLGRAFAPVLRLLVTVVAFAMSQLFRPVAWVAERIHLDPTAIQAFFDRLRAGQAHPPAVIDPSGPGTAARVFGLVVLVLTFWLLLVAFRRFRRRLRSQVDEAEETVEVRTAPLPRPVGRSGRLRLHRELPADTVRRWYAETLLVLESKGMAKPPSATPGEYLLGVRRQFPGCGSGLEALTRAYEDVRYGSRDIGSERIRGLGDQVELLMELIRRAPRREPEPEGGARM